MAASVLVRSQHVVSSGWRKTPCRGWFASIRRIQLRYRDWRGLHRPVSGASFRDRAGSVIRARFEARVEAGTCRGPRLLGGGWWGPRSRAFGEGARGFGGVLRCGRGVPGLFIAFGYQQGYYRGWIRRALSASHAGWLGRDEATFLPVSPALVTVGIADDAARTVSKSSDGRWLIANERRGRRCRRRR